MCPMQSGSGQHWFAGQVVPPHDCPPPPLQKQPLDPDGKSRSEEIMIKATKEIHMKTSEKYSLQNIARAWVAKSCHLAIVHHFTSPLWTGTVKAGQKESWLFSAGTSQKYTMKLCQRWKQIFCHNDLLLLMDLPYSTGSKLEAMCS